jgi:hypothetical protein
VAVALALAASVVFLMRPKEDTPIAVAPVVVAPTPSGAASAEPGVDVDVAESGNESVNVFYVANEGSRTTSVVVWVDEPGGK